MKGTLNSLQNLHCFSMFQVPNVHCACGGHVDDVMILALAPEGSPEATTVKRSQGSLPWS